MLNLQITRRFFLRSAAGAAVLLGLPGCGRLGAPGERERQALLRVARLLYPHEALPDGVYEEVLTPLHEQAAGDPALAASLRGGLEELDRVGGEDWMTATIDGQVASLERIEDSAFFETVREAVRAGLYEHPEVWKLIGYDGSSVEYGGYIARGFDDIDWLPED